MALQPAQPWQRLTSLRALILASTVIVLALPFVALTGLRTLETLLHRQTEAKLAAEAAYVHEFYLRALRQASGAPFVLDELLGAAAPDEPPADERVRAYPVQIDARRTPLLPAPEPAGTPRAQPDRRALAAGAAIEPLLTEVQRWNLSAVRVLDAHGVVVATTGTERGLDLASRTEVAAALTGHYAAVLRARPPTESPGGLMSRAGRVRVFVAFPIVERGRVAGVVYCSRTSLSPILDVWEPRFSVALAGVALAALAVGLLLATLVARPLRRLVAAAQQLAAGATDVSLRVDRFAPREAQQLAQALDAMVSALQQRAAYVRDYTRGIAHELKTPIAAMRGALELLRDEQEPLPAPERERFLANLDSDVARLQRLVQRLSELARYELGATHVTTGCDAATVVASVVHEYAETGRAVSFIVRGSGDGRAEAAGAPGGACPVPMPDELLATLVRNLIDNGLAHGAPPIEVEVGPGPHVAVIDHGPGIAPEHQAQLFERFFTTARERGGTGLGLAIVRALAEAHGATVRYVGAPGRTAFVVTFGPGQTR